MNKIILASSSPRRSEIFAKLRLPFEIVASNYKEDMTLKMSPKDLAKFLSREKAQEVAKRFKAHLIIGVDTFVVLDKEILGKPHTKKVAKEMLEKINGKKLKIITGFAVINSATNRTLSKTKTTNVFIKKLSSEEIKSYIATKEPLDKAGAFAIQGIGAVLIKKIDGDYFNAVGLSLFEIAKALKKFEIKVL